MPTKVGDKFVLWQVKTRKFFEGKLGNWHLATVVLKEIPVTVSEVKTSNCTEECEAIAGDGTIFIFTQGFWQNEEDLYLNACWAYNFGGLYVRENGTRAVPAGTIRCDRHGFAYMPDNEMRCQLCRYEKAHD